MDGDVTAVAQQALSCGRKKESPCPGEIRTRGNPNRKDLDCIMRSQNGDEQRPEEGWLDEAYLARLSTKFDRLSDVAGRFGAFANSAMESFAQVFVSLPIFELIVTIGAFVSSGLAAELGLEVLAGLVFAQAAALYLVSHYRKIAMHPVGLGAIFLSILTGAINTGAAVYLGLVAHDAAEAPRFIVYLVAFSGGLSILYYYIAKMFTAEQVATRKVLAVETAARLAEISRSAAAQRERDGTLATMQQTRLTMEKNALLALAKDPTMAEIQKRAMWLTIVKEIMVQYEVKPQEKLGKKLLELAEKAVMMDGETAAAAPAPAAAAPAPAPAAAPSAPSAPRRRQLPEALEKALAGLSEEEAQALLDAAAAGDFLEPATNGYSNGHGKNGA